MNNTLKKYLLIWTIVVLTFSAICFLVPTDNRFSSSFWIAYVMIILSFGVKLISVFYSLRESNATKVFYNIPIINISYIGTVIMFIVGTPSLVIPLIPNWISVVSCLLVLSVTLCILIFASIAVTSVNNSDIKNKERTFFMDSLIADSEALISRANDTAIKTECEKIYKTIRYSDPTSNELLSSIETQITTKFSEFSDSVNTSNENQVKKTAKELMILLDERNKKCKISK